MKKVVIARAGGYEELRIVEARTDLMERGMSRLLASLDDGSLQPPTVARHRFERVAEAHAALESGRTVGKLVLEM